MKHLHVLGGTGMGKSTLLVRMILDDIEAGHGVGVIDPHGDLIDEVAGRIPESRLDDVVFFDPTDEERVVGWNILGAHSEVERDLLASDLVGVFRRLSSSWGDQMTAVLANAILVFLESERGGTLVDLRRFLVDQEFRNEMLATLPDPHVASFWEIEYPLLLNRRPQAPILTRLDTFLRSRLIRRVVTVREPKLDFRKVTDDGRIFLGKLAMGVIGEENAALLGSLLVSKFHQATIARAGQAVEDRRPFFLFIDEFHHVATASMAALFSGVRKYRLGLTVAHQDLHQLHRSLPEVERSILANAHTRICFRLGDDDARQMERGFSYFTDEDLMRLDIGEAICRVGGRDNDFNLRTVDLSGLDAEDAAARRTSIRDRSRQQWGLPVVEDAKRPATSMQAAEDSRVDQAVDSPPSPETRPNDTAPEVEKQNSEPASRDAAVAEPSTSLPQITKAELDYLELVAEQPFLSVRDRNDGLGLSAWKGQDIKKSLVEQKLVREVPVNPGGRGKRFQLLELTSSGRSLLSGFGLSPSVGHGRGGVAHQWWVNTIVSWLEAQGFAPQIEDDSTGARVDILFSARRRTVAVEVEMTDGHVLENIRKDLAAGVDLVASLLDAPSSLERLERQILSELREDLPRVHIGPLWGFEELLASILDARRSLSLDSSSSLRRPNQNKEPKARRHRRASQATRLGHLSEPGALTTPEAADYLALSPSTLEALRWQGGGPPFVKIGRRVVYRSEDLDRWLEERVRKSTSDPGSA